MPECQFCKFDEEEIIQSVPVANLMIMQTQLLLESLPDISDCLTKGL